MSKKLGIKKRPPIHPGEQLADILKEAGMSANPLALQIRVPANRITTIIAGKRAITADTALRLAKFFGTSVQFWMNLQSNYDISVATDMAAEQIDRDVTPMGRKAG
jgi:antitoxin HigA-1